MAISLLNPDTKIVFSYGEGQQKPDPKFSFDKPQFRGAIADKSEEYVPAEFETAGAAHDVLSRVLNGQGSTRLS